MLLPQTSGAGAESSSQSAAKWSPSALENQLSGRMSSVLPAINSPRDISELQVKSSFGQVGGTNDESYLKKLI